MTRRRCDRGVTIVEAAFAIPILFMFMMGLIDLGLWTFNSNQATNAARDGARAGIIDYRYADKPNHSSGHWQAIVDRVEEHLPGQEIAEENITITCVRVDGGIGCEGAHPGQDTIRVVVDWDWNLLTPIAGVVGLSKGEASGTATMRIIGRPGDAPPATPPVVDNPGPPDPPPPVEPPPAPVGPCVVDSIVVSRDDHSSGPPRVTSAGRLEAIDIAFTPVGDVGCTGLAVQLTPPTSSHVLSATCETCAIGSQVWNYAANDKVWSVGTATVRVFNSNVDRTFQFEVVKRT